MTKRKKPKRKPDPSALGNEMRMYRALVQSHICELRRALADLLAFWDRGVGSSWTSQEVLRVAQIRSLAATPPHEPSKPA